MSMSTPRILAIAALGALTLAAGPAQAALVGFWNFENTLNDVSGNANHGTGFNSPTFVADTPGALGGSSTRSLSFSGAAHVIVANEENFDLGNSITVSTWVKGGLPGTWDPFISKNGEPNGWQLRRHGGDATIDWTTRGAGANNGDFASTNDAAGQVINNDPGNWHHIVGTFNGAVKRIYIDGVLNNTEVVSPSSISNATDSVVFGGRQNPGPGVGNTSFEGMLDNVAIYNHALTSSQVAFLAAGGNPAALPAATSFEWDFRGGNLNGWTAVNGQIHYRTGDGGGVTPFGTNAGEPGFAWDFDHTNLVFRSPAIQFNGTTLDGTNVLSVDFAGGAGDQEGNGPSFANPAAVIAFNGGNSDANGGEKAVAILDALTGQYVAWIFNPSDGNQGFTHLSQTQFNNLGLMLGKTYYLDFYENDEVAWGWGQLRQVNVAAVAPSAAVLPEPASALLALGGLAAMGLRRRRLA